jgi:hypothetical protein
MDIAAQRVSYIQGKYNIGSYLAGLIFRELKVVKSVGNRELKKLYFQ